MNTPTKTLIDRILVDAGADSLALGSGSIGLIAAPFTPSPTLTMAQITEATYDGYARGGYGTPSVPFTGVDGLEYIQGNTLEFRPSDTTTVNTIYGIFFTSGHDTTVLQGSDALPAPVFFTGTTTQLTVTPRFGLNPTNGLGINVISN